MFVTLAVSSDLSSLRWIRYSMHEYVVALLRCFDAGANPRRPAAASNRRVKLKQTISGQAIH